VWYVPNGVYYMLLCVCCVVVYGLCVVGYVVWVVCHVICVVLYIVWGV